MDILTHTLCGVAVGTVVASFSNKTWKDKMTIFTVSAIGGAISDIDAISMWSKFDATFGKVFHFSHSGKDIYTEKFWYSHHAFFHSIIGGLFLTLLIGFIFYLLNQKKNKNLITSFQNNFLILIGFFGGFFLHLLCDMPTPNGAWGGVNLFFPSKTYIGGTGQIWWWNNYDIFLIVTGVILINLVLLSVRKFKKWTIVIFTIGLLMSVRLINSRNIDFNQKELRINYQKSEEKSKEIQKKILGNKVYEIMNKFDNIIPLNF